MSENSALQNFSDIENTPASPPLYLIILLNSLVMSEMSENST